MSIESIVRLVAGTFVTLSLLGAHLTGAVDLTRPSPLWLAVFVGLNLTQSSLTGFCPVVSILRRLGIGSEGASSRA